MPLDTTHSALRRRNVKPLSTTIRADLTKDVDCSAMTLAPEDGEWIAVTGGIGALGLVNFAAAGTAVQANAMKMTYGSATRSDRQQYSETRVPVVPYMNDFVVECELFNHNAAVNIDHTDNYPLGTFVSLAISLSTVQGAVAGQRLVMTPAVPGAPASWAFGIVEGYSPGAAGKIVSAGSRLHVKLFTKPHQFA